ncbi:DUF6745 domain-containing protein [Actinomadura sp. 21ATH]|uniref:DUF6745 domain-containing protein n=1 Tax=Actinomadura sp. 21ATH TaxID=1735444 RepID=UPI0035C0C754
MLSTRPADRPAAEAAISGLYGLLGLDPPRFHWVPSPLSAVETVPPGTRLRPGESAQRMAEWPLPRRFSDIAQRLSSELDVVLLGQFRLNTPVTVTMDPLRATVDATLGTALRAAHGSTLPRHWPSTLSAAWIARYDACRRMAGDVFTPGQARRLDLWAGAARACRWWWPREDVCVVSENPVALHTEEWDGRALRLHAADGPAMRFADGFDVHAWHGARIPAWVIDDPAPWRIEREGNVEVRRCAIERIGWGAYIDRAGLRLLGTAPDPGNPGSELRLYDLRRDTRVLLAVNGSVERDGTRRRYGLTVPGHLSDPVAAAGWTYGLSAEQYSRLVRRT